MGNLVEPMLVYLLQSSNIPYKQKIMGYSFDEFNPSWYPGSLQPAAMQLYYDMKTCS